MLTLFRVLPPMGSKYTDRGSEHVVQDRLGHFRAVLGIPDLRASVHNTARKKSKSVRRIWSFSSMDTPVAGEGASKIFELVGTAATQGDWSSGEGDVDVSPRRAETAHAVALPMLNTAVRATGVFHRQQMRLSATAGARGGISAGNEARPGARMALGLVSPSPAVRPGVFEKSQRLLARLCNA